MQTMQAIVLDRPRMPLVLRERPLHVLGAGETAVAVTACGVWRTDLHVVDGRNSYSLTGRSAYRLSMTDHAFDRGRLVFQRAL